MPTPQDVRSLAPDRLTAAVGCEGAGGVTTECYEVPGKVLRYKEAHALTVSLRTRHTLEPLAWHWSHWPGKLVTPTRPADALLVWAA